MSTVPDEDIKPSKLPLFASLSIVAILVLCYFIFPSFQNGVKQAFDLLTSDDEEALKAWVSQFGLLGPIIIIVGMVVQMFLFVVPNIALMMISILCYGPIWGAVIALIGVFCASSLGYLIGSRLSRVTLNKFVSVSTQKKISEFIRDYGVGAIMITRLSSFSNDALSFVAGILKMSYYKYILSTLTGITPLIVLLAIYGNNGKIEKALIWISAISLALLIAYIVMDKKRKKKAREKAGPVDTQNNTESPNSKDTLRRKKVDNEIT
jgi:uncharacterized membrane protein YdjX (TVP38/TMEM64 family)